MPCNLLLLVGLLLSSCASSIPAPSPTPGSPTTAAPSFSPTHSATPSATAVPAAVLADVDLGAPAYAIAIDPIHHRVFVRTAETVLVLDASTLRTLATIPLGPGNQWTGLAFDDVYGYLWAPSFDGTVAIIAGLDTTWKVIATVTVESNAGPVAVDARTHLAYVLSIGTESRANSVRGSTAIINPNTHQVVSRLRSPGFPMSVAVNSATGRAYVATRLLDPSESPLIEVLSGDTLQATTSVGVSFTNVLAVDDRTNRIYGIAARTAPAGGFVTMVDGRTATASTFIVDATSLSVLAVDPARGHVYVASRSGELAVATERSDGMLNLIGDARYATPAEPTGVAADGSTHRVYVVSFSGRLAVLRDDWP